MANHNDRILRFHVADKVFHGLNAILWFALVITGAIVYLCKPEAATGESLMAWHVGLGIVFTLNLVGYLLFAPERFALMINACLIWIRTRSCGSATSAATRVASSRSRSVRLRLRRRAATTPARKLLTCSSPLPS